MAPTRKLIYSLHAMPYTTNRQGNSTGRNLLMMDGQPTGQNTAPTWKLFYTLPAVPHTTI